MTYHPSPDPPNIPPSSPTLVEDLVFATTTTTTNIINNITNNITNNIVTVNAWSLIRAGRDEDIIALISAARADILVVQETWLNTGQGEALCRSLRFSFLAPRPITRPRNPSCKVRTAAECSSLSVQIWQNT